MGAVRHSVVSHRSSRSGQLSAGGRVISVRQILCASAPCSRLFYLCPWCDRGDWYCDACKRHRGWSARREIARRYWRGDEGKLVTALRLKRWRKEQRAKNVTDPG